MAWIPFFEHFQKRKVICTMIRIPKLYRKALIIFFNSH